MISSFLQMMGFAVRKPEPTVAPVSAVADVNGDKPKPRSVKPRAKAAAKSAPTAVLKVTPKGASAKKLSAPITAKPETETPIETPTNSAANPAANATTKSTVKPAAAPLPVSSRTAKKAAPAVPKTLTPILTTSTASAAPKKAAKNTAVKEAVPETVKVTVKETLKAAPKPSKVLSEKSSEKPPEKPSKKPSEKAIAAAKPVIALTPAEPAPEQILVAGGLVMKPVVPRAARGSRLAQLTVPSMAQSVASTAAKASYSQIMSTPTLAPPTHIVPKKDPKLANNWKTKAPTDLTDAEVMAMSDDEYMSAVQQAFFRGKLVVLKNDILNSAGATTEHLREDTVVVPDPADRATIEEEHALELRTRDRERKLLKKIEQSIHRIDSGDYGYCDETGEPIGVGRLLARPTASLSLEAQQRRELKQKMFGD
jgi:DnaK suppressor protein